MLIGVEELQVDSAEDRVKRLDACYVMDDATDDIMPCSGSALSRPMGLDTMAPLTG
jgi:hypothetical protein